MKICAICHKKNEDDYNYCVHCGAELDNTSEKEEKQATTNILNDEQFSLNDAKQRTTDSNFRENEYINDIQNNNTNASELMSHKIKMIYLPLAITIILAVIAGVTAQILLIFLCIPFAIWGMYGIHQLRHTCPVCKTWNSLKEVSRTETGRYNTTVQEKRTAKTYQVGTKSYVRTGYPIEETDYYVDVPVQVVNYNINLRCECCGYETSRKASEQHKC